MLPVGVGGCDPELTEPRAWLWSGALGPRSVEVRARVLDNPAPPLFLRAEVTGASGSQHPPDRVGASGVAAFSLTGLSPGTRYRIRVGGMEGGFRTPLEGPQSFRIAFGSCSGNGSEHPVFEAIRARDPLLFLHLGDMHYRDIDRPDRERFLRAYDEALSTPAQARLYRHVPLAYVWDDHDFGPNDADRTAPGRETALGVFREVVPHHPLGLSDPLAPAGRAFTVGRVRFVLTDLRSARSPRSDPRPTMLGSAQKAWLLAELSRASRTHALVVWGSPVPWISDRSDDWGGYPAERREISNHIVREGIDNLLMVAGDAHMVALDDGRHNDFASVGPGPGFPVFHASALDRSGSVKGGPYSEGVIRGGGHFGELDFEDDGAGPLRVTGRGRTADGRILLEHAFRPAPS